MSHGRMTPGTVLSGRLMKLRQTNMGPAKLSAAFWFLSQFHAQLLRIR